MEAVQSGIAAMAEGIKELGVPSIDPYLQKEQRFDYKNNQVRLYLLNIINLIYSW